MHSIVLVSLIAYVKAYLWIMYDDVYGVEVCMIDCVVITTP